MLYTTHIALKYDLNYHYATYRWPPPQIMSPFGVPDCTYIFLQKMYKKCMCNSKNFNRRDYLYWVARDSNPELTG